MKIAVIGVTGLVGNIMIKVLEEQKINISKFIPVASEKSLGKSIYFNNQTYKIKSIEYAISEKPDITIFSAGSEMSKKYAPGFAKAGTFVIDNSSAWRMDKKIPLIVPEINADILTRKDKIIANPNCSTIQMVMALYPLHKKYKIKRLVISTYQSVTGTGVKAVKQLENERKGLEGEMAYPYPIDKNVIPQGGDFLDNGYTSEEMKLVDETRKILSDNRLRITSTVVRVPVTGGHSEAVNIEFKNDFAVDNVRKILSETKGIILQDDVENLIYPMPRFSEGRDEVFVGRIRKDISNPRSLDMWIVSDNLRKGAATNAVQIVKYLIDNII